MPARPIQALARHSDLNTTELYLDSSREVVQLGVDMPAKSSALGGVPVIGEPIATRRKWLPITIVGCATQHYGAVAA